MNAITLQELKAKLALIKANPPRWGGCSPTAPVIQFTAGELDSWGFRQAIANPNQHPNNIHYAAVLKSVEDRPYRDDGACFVEPVWGEAPAIFFWSYDQARDYQSNGCGPRGSVAARILWGAGQGALTEWYHVVSAA